MISFTILFSIIGSLIIGAILGYFARQTIAKKQAGTLEAKLQRQIEEAREKAKEILLSAKDKAVKILEDVKKEERERQLQLNKLEARLVKKEELLEQKYNFVEKEKQRFQEQIEKVKNLKNEIEQLKAQEIKKLEEISGLSLKQAEERLFDLVEAEYKEKLAAKIRSLEKEGREEIERKTKELMISTMQRFSSSLAAEVTVTTVSLPSSEIKGKIIGKEGRNIRAFERATGVEVIIDETPDAITLSSFDPIRREIARIAMEKLIEDGRIQPARIEEIAEKAKEEVNEQIIKAGEEALYELGIVGVDPRLVQLLGRLKFRTSFGQNVLRHSIEAAHIAGMIAIELGLNVDVVKKAALFHDIGKAVDHEIQGSHVEIGRKILQKFNIDENVIKAMQSHHEEYPFETPEAFVVQAAEALSASRPGARRGTLEAYLKRLEELEKIVMSFKGVEKAYAIQAGREVRIFVNSKEVDDYEALKLAKEIAKKIEEELKYPGEIKVNVIRETRAVEYAK